MLTKERSYMLHMLAAEDLAAFGDLPYQASKQLVGILTLWLNWEDAWVYWRGKLQNLNWSD